MSYTSVLVVSDNDVILRRLVAFLQSRPDLVEGRRFRFACSPGNAALAGMPIAPWTVEPLDVKGNAAAIVDAHDLVISAHCKQLFPPALTAGCKCINIHPGLNPHNRGWYPQVFSILNGRPLGATIHEIDDDLDHGPVIDQEPVPVFSWDTSYDAYTRVLDAEEALIRRSLPAILANSYTAAPMPEGSVNLKRDFEALREIRLDERLTFGDAIDRLRALTHGSFRNAFFRDPATGRKVFISVTLQPEDVRQP